MDATTALIAAGLAGTATLAAAGWGAVRLVRAAATATPKIVFAFRAQPKASTKGHIHRDVYEGGRLTKEADVYILMSPSNHKELADRFWVSNRDDDLYGLFSIMALKEIRGMSETWWSLVSITFSKTGDWSGYMRPGVPTISFDRDMPHAFDAYLHLPEPTGDMGQGCLHSGILYGTAEDALRLNRMTTKMELSKKIAILSSVAA